MYQACSDKDCWQPFTTWRFFVSPVQNTPPFITPFPIQTTPNSWQNSRQLMFAHAWSPTISGAANSVQYQAWVYIAHLRQQCHNSKLVIFQEKLLKVLKCYTFLWVQWRHNCSPAASFANYVMTLYLLKVHLPTFLSTPITQKWQILSCNTLVANERYVMDPNWALIET